MKYNRSPNKAAEQTTPQTLVQSDPPAPELDATVDARALAATVDAPLLDANARAEQPASDSAEIPGALYSRFESFELLGRGGMGVVYKARDIRLGRDIAIKLLFGADPQFGGSLLREARAQARIEHENVCEVYEAGTVDNVRFIVMQLIAGEPLDKAKSTMTLEEKVRVIRQIASALHEAHRLGMVHRDVKPANIMVERAEDGSLKPYIMDFGLARETGDSGATVSGALMGTPSFMSPEQAAGKVRSLDRRTDVFSLGATLYEVLVGRPPFVADGLAELLQAIVLEEPLSPRQIDREVPLALDAIIMRCIEKHPASRYESAKALGDDLQRFLDDEPVEALKRARLYALWRRAKRHKVKLSIGTAVVIVAAIFLTGWLRARQRAEKEATLSRELGESVKEMEFFLRNAQGMPLHDIDRERNIVRGKLDKIVITMQEAGDIGVGPGQYALGRGHLALGQHRKALEHLRRAKDAGYRATGLDYALGLTLGEIYRQELAETKRLEGERKKKRIAEIEVEYKAPALVFLKAALGDALEAPSFAEGLIAFYEGRFEETLPKAREAFEKAPWLYEAKKLEADALFEIGKKFGHDAAFDFDKMSKWFGEADAAYRVAVEIGRSDPAVHVAMCELYTQRMNGDRAGGKPIRPRLEEATDACDKANRANPSSGLGYLRLAQAHANFAWHVAAGDVSNDDPETALKDAITQAENAARRNPDDPMAHWVVGSIWRTGALRASDRGLDVVPAVNHAIAAYDEALKLDPSFVWALNESCSAYANRARRESMRGIDPTASAEAGLRHCRQAIDIEPTFSYARSNEIFLLSILAEYRTTMGQSPREVIEQAEKSISTFKKLTPNSSLHPYWTAAFCRIQATYDIDARLDPSFAMKRFEESANELARLAPTSTTTQIVRSDAMTVLARFHSERGEDPSTSVNDAVQALTSVVKAKPSDLGYRIRKATVETIGLRWRLAHNELTEPQIEEVLAPLSFANRPEITDPRLFLAMAELKEVQALLQISKGDTGASAIAQGLLHVDRAIELHPRMLLLRARNDKDQQRRDSAKKALEAFSAAIKENPLLTRRLEQDRADAQRLGADPRELPQ
jgi:eukaryotic-like serine/threonine-protein kinase